MRPSLPLVLSLLTLSPLWSADPADGPMVEVEAHFVKATSAQMADALHLPPDQATPNISGFAGNLNEKIYQETLEKLKAGGAELLADLRTVTLPGRSSKVDAVRELRYPAEYDRQADGKAVPTSFETRNVGTELECTLLSANVEFVTLRVNFSVTKFEGFVDSTRSEGGQKIPLAEALRQPLRAGATWSPVFANLQFDSELAIPSGSAVLLDGRALIAPGEPPREDSPQVFVFLTTRLIPAR